MINTSAPGNLMLMGEHAVLEGELALVLAVDVRVSVSLQPRTERVCQIDSALAQLHCDLDQLPEQSDLSFVLEAIRQLRSDLPSGFELRIHSDFSHQVGLGSSAAVTVACVAALMYFAGQECHPADIFDRALSVVHAVQQGRGSGADLAASVYGGLVAYRVAPRELLPLSGSPEISLHYVGYKMKTPDVIRHVEQLRQSHPELYRDLYRLMGQVTQAAKEAILKADWQDLGRLMNQYAGLMDALGVCDASLAQLQFGLRAQPGVLGAKISGSGLGDSVIALGCAQVQVAPYQQIPAAICARGVEIQEG